MKLLIITQAVDRANPIMGFFCRWIEELAAHNEKVIVIGQTVGEYNLPSNVEVHSLGKEAGRSTQMQIVYFWKLLLQLRGSYDAVFVHMICWWMILGIGFWLQKARFMWYEHRQISMKLRVAVWLSHKVFSVSSKGMPVKTPKSVVVGHGIDTSTFTPNAAERLPHQLISVGRFAPAKRVREMVEAFAELPSEYQLLLIGGPVTATDEAYYQEVQRLIDTRHLRARVRIEQCDHKQIPEYLKQASLFIHASHTGLDKAVLEAMACGCPILSAAQNVPTCAGVYPVSLEELPTTIKTVVTQPVTEPLSQALHEYIEEYHSLPRLAGVLMHEMTI